MGLNKTQYSQQNIHSSGFFLGGGWRNGVSKTSFGFYATVPAVQAKQTSNSINLFTGKIFT